MHADRSQNQATVPDYTAQEWRVTPVAIGSLPACVAATVGVMAVNNGVTSGVSGYGVAVGATGAATRLVFCNSAGWTYH